MFFSKAFISFKLKGRLWILVRSVLISRSDHVPVTSEIFKRLFCIFDLTQCDFWFPFCQKIFAYFGPYLRLNLDFFYKDTTRLDLGGNKRQKKFELGNRKCFQFFQLCTYCKIMPSPKTILGQENILLCIIIVYTIYVDLKKTHILPVSYWRNTL